MAMDPRSMTPSATAPQADGRAETARILVTDDQPEVLRAVTRTLEGPYACEFATELGEVREKLAAGSFELALCGVTMPGAAGLALAEEIGRDHRGTAVVLVTAEDDPEVASQAFRFGVYGYLVEPFWPGQLLITVMSALRRRELEIAGQGQRDNLTEQRQRIIDMDITDENKALRLRDELTATQEQAIEELWTSHRETVDCFATAIRLHDSATGGHVNRMASVASLLGNRLQLGHGQVRLLRIAAPMHDVGKIAITDRIIRKPGPLTADERREMQRHAMIGHEILSGTGSELLDVAATIARTHHECFDGSGYPEGLAGYDIPIEGRITAVADVFDALLSDRCYRPAFSTGEAIELVTAGRGTQFDPAIVDALVDNLDEALAAVGA